MLTNLNKGMVTMTEREIINQMLQIEKDACQSIEETKDKANRLLMQSRKKSRVLTENTQKTLSHDNEVLRERLLTEAERTIEKINKEKQAALEKIEMQGKQRRETAIHQIKKFLFNGIIKFKG
jgi:vacuolar-type H+-ATPase subunit H